MVKVRWGLVLALAVWANTVTPLGAQPPATALPDVVEDKGGVTPLMTAALSGKLDAVQQLLAGGANVKATATNGVTALLAVQFRAATPEQLEIAKLLLAGGANVNAKDIAGWTPLLVASVHGNAAMCQLLVDKGADVNAASVAEPATPPGIDAQTAAAVDSIYRSLAEWKGAERKAFWTSFWANVANTAVSSMATVASRTSAPTIMGRGGQMYKVYTVYTPGFIPPARVLLGLHRPNSDPADPSGGQLACGRTALHEAAIRGNVEIARLLLAHGANPAVADEDGALPIDLAMENDHDQVGVLLVGNGVAPRNFTEALRYGSEDDVNQFLAAGANLTTRDAYGDLPIHAAARLGRAPILTILLAKGADVNAVNAGSHTALELAAGAGQIEAVRLLLGKGAKLRVKSTYSALHGAANGGYNDIVELLLASKADPNAKCDYIGTPLQLAVEGGHIDTVKLLLSHGAQPAFDDRCQGTYPSIFIAARDGNNDLVNMLLDAKAIPTARVKRQFAYTEGQVPYCQADAATWAVVGGHLDTLKLLLQRGCQARSVGNGTFFSPLAAAALEGNVEILEFLLSQGADKDINTPVLDGQVKGSVSPWIVIGIPSVSQHSTPGRSPIFFAVQAGRVEAAKILIAHGAKLTGVYSESHPYGLLHVAASQGDPAMATLLLDHGLDPAKQSEKQWHQTALHLAIAERHPEFAAVLIQHGAPVDVADEKGRTPLLMAAEQGLAETAALLLDKGAKLTTKEPRGGSVLHLAAANGQIDVAKLLVARGAALEAKDVDQLTPAGRAVVHNRVELARYLVGQSPTELTLRAAALTGDLEAVRRLDGDPAAVRETDVFRQTPLHKAAVSGNTDILAELIAKGADVNAQDGTGFTPLHLAAVTGWTAAVQLLLEKGAKVDAGDDTDGTPLYWAVFSGQLAVAEVLLAKGANPNQKNADGFSPFLRAVSDGNLTMARLLARQGADFNGALQLAEKNRNQEMVRYLRRLIYQRTLAR